MRITVTRSVIQAEAARKLERRAERRRRERRSVLWRRRTRAGREPRVEPQTERPVGELTKL